jgi:hypothetical protein
VILNRCRKDFLKLKAAHYRIKLTENLEGKNVGPRPYSLIVA